MGINQSVENILNVVHCYKWTFTINNKPSQISCIAFSVDEARSQILKNLSELDEIDKKFPRINEMSLFYLENDEFEKANERVQEREYQYKIALQEKGKYIENVSIKYRSDTVIDSRDFMTLDVYISKTNPIIDTVKPITFIG